MLKGIQNILSQVIFEVGDYSLAISDIVVIVLIIFATKFILRLTSKVMDRFVTSEKLERRNKQSFMLLLKYIIWVFAIVLILETIGVQITLLLAGSAALLVGLGLGLQQIFSDIVSGVFLLVEGSVKIGDIMQVDDLVGRVTTINLRTSEILTRDGIVIIVPNHKFIVENVVNWSHNATITRFNVTVGVAYGTDPKLVSSILKQCAVDNTEIVTNGKYSPIVRLVSFGDSSLDFELLFWSRKGFTIENTKSDLRFLIVDRFREHGVEIPFPQRDLHLKSGKF